jgi:muconolactone delta-isomerase
MSQVVVEGLESRVFEELNDGIQLPDFEGFHAYLRSDSSFYSNIPADMMITKEVERFPESLDRLDHIENWFPNKKFEVPIVGVNVKYRSEASIDMSILDEMQIGSPSVDIDFPEFYLVIHEESVDPEAIEELRSQENVIITDLMDRQSIRAYVCHEIITHHLAGSLPTIDNHEAIPQIVSELKPKVFHYNDVKGAYEEDQSGPLIVLLSVYFESYCYNELEDHLDKIKSNPAAGTFFDRDGSFKRILDACRFFSVIEEDEYTVINLVRDARNKYAHQLERYHASETTELERLGRMDDAISVYEKFIGVKDSMIS